jgi:hypothetical protein
MGILQAAAANFGLYILLQFVVIPKLVRRLSNAGVSNAYPFIATLLIAELARAASLIVAASLGLVVGSLWLIPKFASFGSQEQLAHIFEFLRHLRERIEHIDAWWGIATIGIMGLALWLATKHEAKRQADKAVETAFEKLKSDAQAGGLPDLPSTPEMQAIESELEKRRSRITEILSKADGPDAAERDPKRNPELARLVSEAEALDNWHTHLDVTRRLDVGGAISETMQPTAGKPERSHSLLLSAGFFKLISGASRGLTIASLALLAPALIAVASGGISEATQNAIVHIHDLILKNTIKQAEESWSHALDRGPEKRELTKADDVLIDQLSQQFQSYVQQQNSSLVRGTVEVGRSLVQNSARQQILQNFAASKPDSVAVRGAASDPESRFQTVKDVVNVRAAEGSQPGNLREQFRRDLSEQAKQAKPQAWEAFRAKASNALRTATAPLETKELTSKLFAEVLNTFGQTALGTDHGSEAFKHLASNLVKPGNIVERSGELRELNRYRFLNGISAGASFGSPEAPLVPGTKVPVRDPVFDTAIRQAAGQMDARLVDADRLWRDHPPSLERLGREGQDLNAAREQIEKLVAKGLPSGLERQLPHALATYADYFPGQLGEETRTPRAKLMSGIPSLKSEIDTRTIARAENFARARSYGALRGFAKVGGVLIGLGPGGGSAPAIVDLRWTEGELGLQLVLQRDDQRSFTFGPFRAEIIRLALAYAADGRPITVTMPSASIGRGILLHPALVDTALGCSARHLDQFVDAFTARMQERQRAEQKVNEHLHTYRFAWASRFKEVFSKESAMMSLEDKKQLTPHKDFADKILATEEIRKAVTATMSSAGDWSNEKISPVTAKNDYFENNLVKTVGRCLPTTTTASAFGQCVAAAPIDSSLMKSGKWIAPPPTLFSESGVREMNYAMDPELSFLDLKRARSATWPFEFMLQVTFESPRYFTEDRGTVSFDETPFEYPNLKTWIGDKVSLGIGTDGSALETKKTMGDLREFAVLQRFFRLALDGKLGQNFPLDALVKLGKVKARASQPAVRTPIWNTPDATAKLLVDNNLASLVEPLGLTRDRQQAATQSENCPVIKP